MSEEKKNTLASDFTRIGEGRAQRRRSLTDKMKSNSAAGLSCAGCTGICCTFAMNSMKINPLEAIDLLSWLIENQRVTESFIESLQNNVTRFGLDRPSPGDGRRSFSRKRYTCPFFGEKSLGCTIAPEAKPYGCLGFNPLKPRRERKDGSAYNGSECGYPEIERQNPETDLSPETQEIYDKIVRELGSAESKPIPVALLALMDLWSDFQKS